MRKSGDISVTFIILYDILIIRLSTFPEDGIGIFKVLLTIFVNQLIWLMLLTFFVTDSENLELR